MAQVITEFIQNKKALVVEDEAAIAQLLKINLTQMGFKVDAYGEADSAYLSMKNNNYELCLIDWMMPGTSGIDFLKKAKSEFKNTKFMMVTAKADADSIVTGLDFGADDYLTKPFDGKVLAARVRNLMRRLSSEQIQKNPDEFPEKMELEGLSIHFARHIVELQGRDIHLTPSEFKLLATLLKAKGRVLTRDQLIDTIQGEDVTVTGRTIDTHVFALRKKIGEWSKHIETIRGVGYRVLLSSQDTSEPEVL